jgi:flagellar motor switch protein FliG
MFLFENIFFQRKKSIQQLTNGLRKTNANDLLIANYVIFFVFFK